MKSGTGLPVGGWWLALTMALIGLAAADLLAEEDTWMYAVQISAVVQASPPRITLNWIPDPHIATNYTVYRKAKSDTAWGSGVSLPGTATNYIDVNVAVGAAYEYQVVKRAQPGYTGYGYIFAGIEAPLVEARGKLILLVANTYAATLSNELARLESDLAGDGWSVIRHDVATNDTPAAVRNLIIADYQADPANVNAVFLFGHVPVLKSGNLNYDTHLSRPMPADAFYGDMTGNWNSSPNFLPADVQLMVGRVDMFNMPGIGAPVPWPSEAELLRNYLNKDHQWRHKLVQVPRRSLMGNRRGDEAGEATASSGYRNFQPLVGPGTLVEANTEDVSSPTARWGPMLAATNYLWAYGCGGGMPTGVSHLGTNGAYLSLFSPEVVGQNETAAFVMVFGSWFGEWDGQDNFMRAFLATPNLGLACIMAGRPHWFVHHMGLGETIGYSTRLSMNNSTLYRNQSNVMTRAIYIALMGDPTLRQDIVAPPGAVTANVIGAGVNLAWSPAGESVLGYHVYRRGSSGSYNRLNSSLVATSSFLDTNAPPGNSTYMVRAVKLQSTPSGSFYNASQGMFAAATVPLRASVSVAPNGITVQWNSQPGINYQVWARGNSDAGAWSNISGTINAGSASTSWTDTSAKSQSRRFYRVIAP